MNAETKTPPKTPGGPSYTPTDKSRVKRKHDRAAYDHETVHGILDAGLIAHVGYTINGEPYVTPTAYWREGGHLYWHGSSASRMLRLQEGGVPACLTVSFMDSLVVARSGFHHSLNYRAVMAFGTAHIIDDLAEKERALDAFVDRIYPGRAKAIRPATKQEIKGTTVIGMEIAEASAKIRAVGVVDDEEDYALPIWAGMINLKTIVTGIEDDPRNLPGIARPDHVTRFTVGTSLDTVLSDYDAD